MAGIAKFKFSRVAPPPILGSSNVAVAHAAIGCPGSGTPEEAGMHDREAHCKPIEELVSQLRDRPRSRPDHAGGAGPAPEVRRERTDQGRARLADRAVLRPVQEHAHHHPARCDDAVRVAGRDRRRGHHRRDRAVLRRAELRAGIPRRQCPQGAEEDAGADDQGPARRRGDAHSIARARSRRHHAAGGRRPHTGGRAPGGDSLSQVRRGAAHRRVVSRREGPDAAAARCGGRRSPQCRLCRDHGDLWPRQGDRDEHRA